MNKEKINFNLRKTTIKKASSETGSGVKIKLYADIKESGLGKRLDLKEDLPLELIENIILFNARRSPIYLYYKNSEEKVIHVANSNYELEIDEMLAKKLTNLMVKLKARACEDVGNLTIARLKAMEGKNLIIATRESKSSEKHFLTGANPLVYTNVGKKISLNFVQTILDMYYQIYGPVTLEDYNSQTMTLYNKQNDGIIKIGDILKNEELKTCGLNLVRKK